MKTHLAQSSKPLVEGGYLVSLCSLSIPNSIFMFRWLEGEIDLQAQSTLLLCKDCVQVLQNKNPADILTYVYGIQNREELKPKQLSKLEALEDGA